MLAAAGEWRSPTSRPATASMHRAAAAIERGLPLVTKAAANYPTHRKCFSCHHQTLPMLAVVSGREVGIDNQASEMLKAQAEHTHASFEKQHKQLLEGNQGTGEGIGGKGLTVGYGLWTLKLADWPADETTAAMVTYLLKSQDADGSWHLHATRPPMEESRADGGRDRPGRHAPLCDRRAKRRGRGGGRKGQDVSAGRQARKPGRSRGPAVGFALAQRGDRRHRIVRSWWPRCARPCWPPSATMAAGPQIEGMTSDAYATGQTLFVLRATGLDASAETVKRGSDFLLKTQQPDGSWLVETRSKPVQVYFDNGDPHGKNQFISTPASCWALAALARGLPTSEKKPSPAE